MKIFKFIGIFGVAFSQAVFAASTLLPITSAEYQFPAQIDPEILKGSAVEIWARLYRPLDLSSGPHPLVVFLHGNHGTCARGSPRVEETCDYTDTGVCPAGKDVIPNHLGYSYLAEELAGRGFYAISINSNRGINCGNGTYEDSGLVLARGNLILRHLQHLYEWSMKGGAPSSLGMSDRDWLGQIDWSRVGLMGHSRGGEGARAALNLYQDTGSVWTSRMPDLKIRAIFEIGAVDGLSQRVLDAPRVAWNQLLPMCDGDVSSLSGRLPFERMLLNPHESSDAQKSVLEVWGANHNFFNTVWQQSDSQNCYQNTPIFDPMGSESEKQRKVALETLVPFFQSHLKPEVASVQLPDPSNDHFLNPLWGVPDLLTQITPIQRDFSVSPSAAEVLRWDDFEDDLQGVKHQRDFAYAKTVRVTYPTEGELKYARVQWSQAGEDQFFESGVAKLSASADLSDYKTLDVRLVRAIDLLNAEKATDFSIALVDQNQTKSVRVKLSQVFQLIGPIHPETVFSTARIPLRLFTGVDLHQIRAVQFVFDQTPSGAVNFSNLRFSRSWGVGGEPPVVPGVSPPVLGASQPTPISEHGLRGEIEHIYSVAASPALGGRPGIEIHLKGQQKFPVRDQILTLKIGRSEFRVSQYAEGSNLDRIIFTLTEQGFARLKSGLPVQVVYGKPRGLSGLSQGGFGRLDKTKLESR